MDTTNLLKAAWEAVESAGVPEHLQETAFKEAVAYLRAQADGRPAKGGNGVGGEGKSGRSGGEQAARGGSSGGGGGDFYTRLAHETGVEVDDLRHVLELVDGADGQAVKVIQPARLLGSSKAEQTRTVVALVGGARRAGLGEDPVLSKAVREECKSKGCLDRNFSANIDDLNGYTLSGRTKLVLSGTRWVPAFKAAVDRLTGASDEKA